MAYSSSIFLSHVYKIIYLTVMESLSCGTPVVAFNVGGMRDVCYKNGYLAAEDNFDDFYEGSNFFKEQLKKN